MDKINKPIGIFGGTFDPIHLGHIKIAEILLQKLGLTEIQFIPNFQSPLRPQSNATPEQRLEMLHLALTPYKEFIVNPLELAHPGPSYTIDTLSALRLQMPQTPLCLLIGADALQNFMDWKNWQEMINYCHIVVVNRDEALINLPLDLMKWLELYKTDRALDLHQSLSGKILFVTIDPIIISATAIRQKLSQKQDACKQLPEKVYEYIKKFNLYHSSS